MYNRPRKHQDMCSDKKSGNTILRNGLNIERMRHMQGLHFAVASRDAERYFLDAHN
jgi:hypothetical protein